jgi:hypothetical protein
MAGEDGQLGDLALRVFEGVGRLHEAAGDLFISCRNTELASRASGACMVSAAARTSARVGNTHAFHLSWLLVSSFAGVSHHTALRKHRQ